MIDLKDVIAKYPQCLESPEKFRSFMLDLYPDNGVHNYVLSLFVIENVINSLSRYYNKFLPKSEYFFWSKKITQKYGIDYSLSKDCLSCWMNAFNIKLEGDCLMNFSKYITNEGKIDYNIIKKENISTDRFVKELKIGCQNFNADAQYILANLLDDQKSYSKAFECYYASAIAGNKYAQYNVGYAYEFGQGTNKNLDTAKYWFEKSFENGYNASIIYLAEIFLEEKNLCESARCYLIGAEKGEPICQYNCFFNYENGEGVPVDSNKAIYWLKLAAKNGEEHAISVCNQRGISF